MIQNVCTIGSASVLKKTAKENQTKSQICKLKRKPISKKDYVNSILCKDPMVLEKLANLTDPITPAECYDRIIFIESEELFVHRCERTNVALSYPNQLQREEICKAYTEDQQRKRKHISSSTVGNLFPSLCDFQTLDMDFNKSESELEAYSFHCCLQRWLTNSILDIPTELRCDSLGQLDSSDITIKIKKPNKPAIRHSIQVRHEIDCFLSIQ